MPSSSTSTAQATGWRRMPTSCRAHPCSCNDRATTAAETTRTTAKKTASDSLITSCGSEAAQGGPGEGATRPEGNPLRRSRRPQSEPRPSAESSAPDPGQRLARELRREPGGGGPPHSCASVASRADHVPEYGALVRASGNPALRPSVRTVRGDWPISHDTVARASLHRVRRNPLGARSVLAEDGRWLGIKPHECEDVDVSWVIVGGESGPHARPSNPQWFREPKSANTSGKYMKNSRQN